MKSLWLAKHYAIKTYVTGYIDHVFFIWALVGDEWSVSRPCHFTSRDSVSPYPLDRRMGAPQSPSGQYVKVKIVVSAGTRNPTVRSSSRWPVVILIIYGNTTVRLLNAEKSPK
jgi:hypothetical protein